MLEITVGFTIPTASLYIALPSFDPVFRLCFIEPFFRGTDILPSVCVQDVLQKLEKLKSQVQELQRDLTLRRCLARRSAVEELKSVIDGVECQLEKHYGYIEEKQPTLEKVHSCLQ